MLGCLVVPLVVIMVLTLSIRCIKKEIIKWISFFSQKNPVFIFETLIVDLYHIYKNNKMYEIPLYYVFR